MSMENHSGIVPHVLTQASVVRGRRLTTGAIARPSIHLNAVLKHMDSLTFCLKFRKLAL
jgi:hypothetical protein